MMLSGHGGGRRLFTASQWQELEHQALIFKYMASGAPVPHDLVLPLRLATGVDTAPSLAFPPQPSPSLAYWGCYGAGAPFGRKAEDPEPGRCRRTDGKKWRCSREAHGDSKYCEKHIHRGKSRSRKPVEVTSPAAYRPSAFSISPPRAADAPPPPPGLGHPQQQHLRHGALSPAGRAPAAGALQLHLDSSLHAASPPPSYHRYAHSHAHYTPPPPQPSLYDYGQSKELREAAELRRRHFHALGADLSLDKPLADAGAAEKPLRRFFDEWPRERGDTRPSWAGAEDATQLSISIPAASPSSDHAASAAARCHNDGSDRCIS
ncbi:Growth-regulating factor 2 [Zea mays]|uniref:Growth-regulating factor n=1 Tax=Zea mays TaxID=4577 RepID=A0A3L6DE61_MAIZE|nr:Growth-regulating factor 2 [Zea mays]